MLEALVQEPLERVLREGPVPFDQDLVTLFAAQHSAEVSMWPRDVAAHRILYSRPIRFVANHITPTQSLS